MSYLKKILFKKITLKILFISVVFFLISTVVSALFLYHYYFQKIIFTEQREFFVTQCNYDVFKNDLYFLIHQDSEMSFLEEYLLDIFLEQKKLNYWFEKGVVDGRYLFTDDLSLNRVINKLRAGDRDPINVTFNSMNSINDVFGVLGEQLQIDSLHFDDYVRSNQIVVDTMCMIPNTYNLYWNTSVEDFFKIMNKECNNFWEANKVYMETYNLTHLEVRVLASIVEKEARHVDEMARISGLYLNRLSKGVKLEADPTIHYCRSKQGEKRKERLRQKHLKIQCSHNTYQILGLPPSPICLPSLQSIKSVLHYEKHNFIYMCAQPNYSGYHNFSTTYRQHKRNANQLYRFYSQEGIM